MSESQNSREYSQELAFLRLSTYSFNRASAQENQPSVYLTDQSGTLHPSSSLINQLTVDDSLAVELMAILATPLLEELRWMCAPIYRDAVVFFDADNRVISILNICVQCDSLWTDKDQDIALDAGAYPKLKTWLQKVGHPIE